MHIARTTLEIEQKNDHVAVYSLHDIMSSVKNFRARFLVYFDLFIQENNWLKF
jgi:hypothetical protein